MGGRGSTSTVSTTTSGIPMFGATETTSGMSTISAEGVAIALAQMQSETQPDAMDVVTTARDNPDAVEDFGEKIGDARKDVWRKRHLQSDDLDYFTDGELRKYVVKKNVWKDYDYVEMVEGGMSPEKAYLLKEIRKSIPNKVEYPRNASKEEIERRTREYVETVTSIRVAAENIDTKEDLEAFTHKIFFESGMVELKGSRFVATEKFYKNAALSTTLFNSLKHFERHYEHLPRLAKDAQIGVPKDMQVPRGFRVSEASDGSGYFIRKGHRVMKSGIKDRELAVGFAQELAKKTQKQRKTSFVPKQLEHISREGPDYRKSSDVDGNKYLNEFGFRGGEFGNWMSQKDRQVSLNYGYDALKDLSDTLEIDTKDVSFSGKLAIAFGSRGRAGAAAHYERDRKVINLSKMSGAGNLAHEWFHALDDIAHDKINERDGMVTEEPHKNNIKSFERLIEAMRYNPDGSSTEYYKNSRKFDQNNSKTDGRYWSSSPEMAARAFASYVTDKTDGKSDYLSGQSETFVDIDYATGEAILAVPQGQERERINAAFDELFLELKDKDFFS